MEKSTRHSKITGDFAEALVLYWLSKSGYECACVDHTGIDLIACNRDGFERMGISVKARSRYDGTEQVSVNLSPDGFEKARHACNRRGYWLDMTDKTLVIVMTQGIGANLTNDEKRAHLIDLKREHLIDQVCVQEILPPEVPEPDSLGG